LKNHIKSERQKAFEAGNLWYWVNGYLGFFLSN